MQGIRQAETVIGEKVYVIGLGLLGQITCQLLQTNGSCAYSGSTCQILCGIANKYSPMTMLRNDPNLRAACDNFTNGHGFDAVIITAAAIRTAIRLAGDLYFAKGKVVVVGVVPMDIPGIELLP